MHYEVTPRQIPRLTDKQVVDLLMKERITVEQTLDDGRMIIDGDPGAIRQFVSIVGWTAKAVF